MRGVGDLQSNSVSLLRRFSTVFVHGLSLAECGENF